MERQRPGAWWSSSPGCARTVAALRELVGVCDEPVEVQRERVREGFGEPLTNASTEEECHRRKGARPQIRSRVPVEALANHGRVPAAGARESQVSIDDRSRSRQVCDAREAGASGRRRRLLA